MAGVIIKMKNSIKIHFRPFLPNLEAFDFPERPDEAPRFLGLGLELELPEASSETSSSSAAPAGSAWAPASWRLLRMKRWSMSSSITPKI